MFDVTFALCGERFRVRYRLTGDERDTSASFPVMAMSARKVIARRAAMEVRNRDIIRCHGFAP